MDGLFTLLLVSLLSFVIVLNCLVKDFIVLIGFGVVLPRQTLCTPLVHENKTGLFRTRLLLEQREFCAVDRWHCFDHRGWCGVPEHMYITGLWRNSCHELYCLEEAYYSQLLYSVLNFDQSVLSNFVGLIRGSNNFEKESKNWCSKFYSTI